jgi:transposase
VVRSLDSTFEPKEMAGCPAAGGDHWCRWTACVVTRGQGRIVAESFAAGANGAVPRRYGLRPQQVYAWRRLALSGTLALPSEEALGFVPVVAAEGEAAPAAISALTPAGIIEIEIAGAVIRAASGVDWRHLRDVLRAVKAAR